jgi:hypothetical protein
MILVDTLHDSCAGGFVVDDLAEDNFADDGDNSTNIELADEVQGHQTDNASNFSVAYDDGLIRNNSLMKANDYTLDSEETARTVQRRAVHTDHLGHALATMKTGGSLPRRSTCKDP